MVRRIGMLIVGATLAAALLSGLSGAAFAAVTDDTLCLQCPAEEYLTIETWYPSPWNSFEELYTMKLGVGDVTTSDGEANLRPKTVGSIKVERSVVFKPMSEDPVPEKDLYTGEYTNVETGEMIYNGGEDKFKYFNGSSWVPQGSGSGKTVVAFTCLWRYDYRENPVGIGPVPLSGAGSWGCTPQACPTSSGWSQLGDIFNDQVALACSGSGACSWDSTPYAYHPVSAGRSVRLCVSQ